MFEELGIKNFVNREQTGDYAEIEFDTYVSTRGGEEILAISTGMHYYEAGEGEPLILVHGLGQNVYTWRKNIEALSRHFHVFAIDLMGHGYSGTPEIAYTIEEEHALSIEAFMNAKQLISANFCAFGESALYVLDFAMHNPARTKGMVAISPMLSEEQGFRGRYLPSVFGHTASRRKVTEDTVYEALGESYFDRTLITDQVVAEYYNGMMGPDFRNIVRMSMNNFFDDDVIAGLNTVKSPVLAIVGCEDKITGGRDSLFLRLTFNKGSFLAVRNSGFLVQEEKPKHVQQGIVTFLGAK